MATRRLGTVLVLLVACAGGEGVEEIPEFDPLPSGVDLEQLELEQVEPVDCRPVRFDDCAHPWNDRACFYVPALPECMRPSSAATDRSD